MTDRRGSRFILEVLFLIALTVALTLANLRPLEIAGIMLVGWVIVAVLEWVAWREEPHFGSGLPPRYYVPQVSLPPAQPLEAVPAGYPGYPEARDEAPTWIASAALRAEMLGEWPLAAPPAEEHATDEEVEVEPDPWMQEEELPAAPLGELDPAPDPDPVVVDAVEAELVLPPVSLPPEPRNAPEPAPEPEPVPEPEPAFAPALDVELARSAQGVARYSLDPLGDEQPRRRFGRGAPPEPAGVEVPARPDGVRALPGRTNRQD